MKNGLKRVVVFGLSACLVFGSLTGCSKKETFDAQAAAATVNGDVIPAGLVKFATHYTQSLYEEMYTMYMGVSDPMNQDLYGNGTTLGAMIKEETVSTLENMVLAEQKMADYGVELTDEEKASVSAAADQFIKDNEEEVLKRMSADKETVERYLTLRVIQSRMEPEMSADIDTEVSDEEAAQRRVQYVLFRAETEAETEEETAEETEASAETEEDAQTEAETAVLTEEETVKTQSAQETEAETAAETETEAGTDAEAADETEAGTEAADETEAETETETETETEDPALAAAMEEAYALAKDMIARVQDGEDFEEAAAAVDPDANCSEMTFGSDSTTVAEGLITATEGLADGTLVEEPIQTDGGYYVAKVLAELDREATDTKKESILEQRREDRISELYTEWKDASEITTDETVLAGIVFDFSLTHQTEAAQETETEAETEAAETETEAETEAAETETDGTEAEETEAAETETDGTEAEETE